MTEQLKKPSARRTALLLTAIVLVPIVPFLILGELPGEAWLEGQEGRVAIGAVGALLLSADVFLPIPSTVVGSLLGLRLGVVAGALWAWVGLVAGNLLGYFAGRLALRTAGLELPAWQTGLVLFVSRPLPILAEAVAIAAGAGRMPIATFLTASLTGNAVFALVLATSGAALISEDWAGVGLAAPLALAAAGYWLLRWLRGRSTGRQ